MIRKPDTIRLISGKSLYAIPFIRRFGKDIFALCYYAEDGNIYSPKDIIGMEDITHG
jgi:hypothetical protein